MVVISVPSEYGSLLTNHSRSYVVLTSVGTCMLSIWHGARCGSFRKAAGLGYPTPYADSAQLAAASPENKHKLYLFNCAQRAHGNYLENHYMALTTLLIGGLRYPLLSSAFGLVWSLGRVVYALGYTSKTKDNGKGRLAGAFFWLAQLGLFVNAGLTGYNL
ncbi:membrane-associated proteins in eicosanoid and glutathione metabolism, partial [Aureobasidium sp. EXF-8845]